MKGLISLTLCILLGLLPAWAQQKVAGKITNQEQKPLEGVTLILKDSSGHILAFGRSDVEGRFQLLPSAKAGNYRLELTSIGYKKKVADRVEAGKPLVFVLETEAMLLEDVVVKNWPRLRNHGDSLDYNPADFANEGDRSIGDVIKKMPGLTMNEAGKIEYNGKAISRLYVDKDNLLDDQYNLATRAIPHSAVEKLQVIEKDQPVKMLRKHNMSDDVAINVVLRKEARIRLMGDVKLGAGLPQKYEANANALLFRKNNKFINNLQLNNIGYDPARELTSHNLEALQGQSDNPKPDYFLSAGAAGVPVLPASRTLFNRAGLISLNNLVKWNETYQFRWNAAYYTDHKTAGYRRTSAVYLPGDTIRFWEAQDLGVDPRKLHAKLELTGNAETYYLKNSLSFHLDKVNTRSALTKQEGLMGQHLGQEKLEFSNEFSFRKMLGAKHSFSAGSTLAKTSLSEQLHVEAGIQADLYNDGEPYQALWQQVTLPTWFAHHRLSFTRRGKIAQTYELTHVFQQQDLGSQLLKVVAKDPVPVAGNTGNDVDWQYAKMGLKALYEYKTEQLTASLGVPLNVRHYQWREPGFGMHKKDDLLQLEPTAQVKYQTGAESHLSGSYAHRAGTGTIADIYAGAILRDYRSLVLNDAPLSRRYTDRVTAAYQSKKALKMFFWNIGSAYTTVRSNTLSSYVLQERQEKRTAVFLENRTHLLSVFTSASKYLFNLTSTVNVGGDFTVSSFPQLQNGQLRSFSGRSLSLTAGILTKVNAAINAEYDVKYNGSQSFSNGEPVREPFNQLCHQLTVNVNAWKNLRVNVSGQSLHTRQPHQPALAYLFADASLVYALKKPKTDLVLNVTNIGNVQKFEAIQLTANSHTSGVYRIPGRMAVLTARFFFN